MNHLLYRNLLKIGIYQVLCYEKISRNFFAFFDVRDHLV